VADRPTCAEALQLVKEALEDDRSASPGPWKVDARDGRHRAAVRDESREVVADVYCGGWTTDRAGHAPLNARFIASARTREPRLAAFVEGLLGAEPLEATRVRADGRLVLVEYLEDATQLVDSESAIAVYASDTMTVGVARRLAAALLRAADEAEAG
jgi:hypothetical protein